MFWGGVAKVEKEKLSFSKVMGVLGGVNIDPEAARRRRQFQKDVGGKLKTRFTNGQFAREINLVSRAFDQFDITARIDFAHIERDRARFFEVKMRDFFKDQDVLQALFDVSAMRNDRVYGRMVHSLMFMYGEHVTGEVDVDGLTSLEHLLLPMGEAVLGILECGRSRDRNDSLRAIELRNDLDLTYRRLLDEGRDRVRGVEADAHFHG